MFVYGLHAKATLIHILDEKSKPKIPKTLCNTYTTSNLYGWVAIEDLKDAPANRKPCKKCFQKGDVLPEMHTIDMNDFLATIHGTLSECDDIVEVLEQNFKETTDEDLKEGLDVAIRLMKLQNKMLRSTYTRLIEVVDVINDIAVKLKETDERI